jgi:hypothetical protein
MFIALNRSTTCALVILAMGSYLSSATRAVAWDADDSQQLNKIEEQWKDQQSNIQTAVIEYRHVSRPAQPKPNHDAVLALLGKSDLTGNYEALGDFITTLDTTLKGQKELWSSCTFTLDVTGSFRNDLKSLGTCISEVRVGNDTLRKQVVDLQGRNQIDVNGKDSPSLYRMPRLSDFVQVPEPRLCEDAVVIHDKQIKAASRVTFQNGIFQCEVDQQTGFVYGYRQGEPNSRACHEVWQFGPTSYSDGILLPAATFSANYRFGVLDNFSIHVIDHAVLNGDINPSIFAVSGDQDDVVVDHRFKPKTVVRLEQHVSDILGP